MYLDIQFIYAYLRFFQIFSILHTRYYKIIKKVLSSIESEMDLISKNQGVFLVA